MSIEVIFALFIFAFVASITPGPNNIMLMAPGTNFGFRKTFPHILGINIGFSTLVFGVGIGLMEVFNAIPFTQIILKFLCGGYLIYLSYKIAISSSGIEKNGEQIKEVPVNVNEIRPSVYNIGFDIPKTLYLILKLRIKLLFER